MSNLHASDMNKTSRSRDYDERPLQLQFLQSYLTHSILLQLAGHRHRELINEPDVFWNLEMRNLVFTVITYLIFTALFILVQLNPGHNFFSV